MGGGDVERVLLKGSELGAGAEGSCGFEVSFGSVVSDRRLWTSLVFVLEKLEELDASAIFLSSSPNPMTEATSMDEDFVLGSGVFT